MSEITVTVTLLSKFTQYREKLTDGTYTVYEGTTALELAVALGIPPKFVIILLINGKQGSPADVLLDGDRVVFVPPAVGGG